MTYAAAPVSAPVASSPTPQHGSHNARSGSRRRQTPQKPNASPRPAPPAKPRINHSGSGLWCQPKPPQKLLASRMSGLRRLRPLPSAVIVWRTYSPSDTVCWMSLAVSSHSWSPKTTISTTSSAARTGARFTAPFPARANPRLPIPVRAAWRSPTSQPVTSNSSAGRAIGRSR